MKKFITYLSVFLLCTTVLFSAAPVYAAADGDYIKWVDFNAGSGLLKSILNLDIKYHGTEVDFKFTEVLAYLSAKNGNRFGTSDSAALKELNKKLENGETVRQIYGDNKYYKYYLECYEAIFAEFIGEYTVPGSTETKYGLTAYFPFAQGFWMSHYDDFGNSRSYGFKRKHLGHDMMGGIGTPIIAVEGGTVKELGWNRYGGWRIGILSKDTKRYYYYAHLRKDRPYSESLELGAEVSAGEVIGYLGQTGYSNKENQNLKSGKPHLHFGLQLIFDESQVKGNKEIWIDLYSITNLLSLNKARTEKDTESKEYKSVGLRKPCGKSLTLPHELQG